MRKNSIMVFKVSHLFENVKNNEAIFNTFIIIYCTAENQNIRNM